MSTVVCDLCSLHAVPLCSAHPVQPYMAVLAGLGYDRQAPCRPGPWSSVLQSSDWSYLQPQ